MRDMANYVKISVLGQPELKTPYSDDLESKVQEMMAYLRAGVEKVVPDKLDLIVVPEVVDRFPSFNMEQRKAYYQYRGDRFLNFYREIAKENHCYIAYSAVRYLPEEDKLPYRNSTQIIGRDGEIVGIYDKNHLVPYELDNGEIAYGTEAPVFELDFGRVACAICFDLNYTELLDRYAAQKPDLIIFSSMYHGGLMQQAWAYTCRAHFVGAICGQQSRVLNPFGETVASSANYFDFVTARVNLDCVIVHLDNHFEKIAAAKKKYGELLQMHDPGYYGGVLLSYEGTDRTVRDIMQEFDMITMDEYFDACRVHRRKWTGEQAVNHRVSQTSNNEEMKGCI